MSQLASCRLLFPRGLLGIIAGCGWSGTTLLAIGLLYAHAYQPNKSPALPSNAETMESSAHYRIKLFAHPFCPCTRASLEQLGASLSRFPADVQTEIIFVALGLDESDVAASSLVARAGELAGAKVRFDVSGAEARRLGASVSGEVFAFDPRGRLVFQGGITAGRGHQGSATGQTELERIVAGSSPGPCATPVYGCRLPTR